MTLRVEAIWTGLGGSPYYSRFHFGEENGGEGGADAVAAAGAVQGYFSSLMPRLKAGLQVTIQPEVYSFRPSDGELLAAFPVSVAPYSGSVAQDPMPRAVQALGQFITGSFVNGRRLRGRTFIPGIPEGEASPTGGLSETFRSNLRTAVDLLRTGAPVGQPLVVWSQPREATENAPARVGAVRAVSSTNVWTEYASLRSRRD